MLCSVRVTNDTICLQGVVTLGAAYDEGEASPVGADGKVWEWYVPWGGLRVGLRPRRAWVQIAAATLSGNNIRQTVHTHRTSVHQAAKLAAALLRVARVTAGLAESNGSLPPGV